jgi:hypothetical protein
MSESSKGLRGAAARELRKSRNGGSAKEKADNIRRAAALKELAHNEEWMGGEKERSKARPAKPRSTKA